MFWKGNSKYSHPLFWMVSIAPWEQIPTSQESTNQCWPHQIHMMRFPVSHQLCSNISHEFSSSLAAQSWVIGVKVMSVTIGRWSDTLPRAHRLTSAHEIRTKRSQDFHCLVLDGEVWDIFPLYHKVSKSTRVNRINDCWCSSKKTSWEFSAVSKEKMVAGWTWKWTWNWKQRLKQLSKSV